MTNNLKTEELKSMKIEYNSLITFLSTIKFGQEMTLNKRLPDEVKDGTILLFKDLINQTSAKIYLLKKKINKCGISL